MSTSVEHLERALADVGEVGAQLGVAQDRQLAAGLARVLDRVVEAAELAVQRLALADRLHQPELLEVGDVAEVPGQRAEDRRVDAVELLVVERLDQLQGAPARLGEALRDRFLGAGRHLGGDAETLARPDYRSVNSGSIGCATDGDRGGRSALVAGGASGLGEATARALVAAGAAVTIADLNAEKGEALAAELGERDASSQADVTDEPAGLGRGRAGGDARWRAADLGLLRRHRLGRAGRPQGRPPRPRVLLQRDQGQPDRHLQRAAPRRRGDERERARRRGRARRLRQHRLDRRLRRPDRPDRLRGLEGRHRRHDPAGRPRHGLARRPRGHDRPGPLRHAAARGPARGGPRRRSAPASPSLPASAAPRSTRSWSARSSPTRC